MKTATKERPIIFSSEMVRAILDGRKTQTRLVVHWSNSTVLGHPAKPYWSNLRFDEAVVRDDSTLLMAITQKYEKGRDVHLSVPYANPEDADMASDDLGWYRVRPKWKAGDRLWVRETWIDFFKRAESSNGCLYKADDDGIHLNPGAIKKWKPSIHMPRWASRITLEITGVRVERVQDISESDAIAEGVDAVSMSDVPRQATLSRRSDFKQLWDELNVKRGFGWDANPWVWVIEFRRAGD